MTCEQHLSVHEPGCLGIHRHRRAYAAIVLSGGFRETGPDGIWDCCEGDLILHPVYHLHADTFSRRGARVLNIDLPANSEPSTYQVVTLADLGRSTQRVQNDLAELAEALKCAAPKAPVVLDDWRDAMAQRLAQCPTLSISALAEEYGASLAHVSRAFRKAFGIGPAAFRAEHRLRAAIKLLSTDGRSIADIAYACGYSDQAHLTRSLVVATGLTPTRARQR